MVTRSAHADLIEIGRFTAKEWGITQRNKYLKLLDDCFQQLSEFSDSGLISALPEIILQKDTESSHKAAI